MTNRELLPAPLEAETRDRTCPSACCANRELSWLAFNRRVLEEAEDPQNPLGERLAFSAIFQSNLDEFFMVRVGGLCHRLGSLRRENKTGLTARQQLERVTEQVRMDLERADHCYQALMDELALYGRQFVTYEQAEPDQQRWLERYFAREAEPLLAPQVVTARQSFPFLSGGVIYAVAVLEKPQGARRLGIVPCTSSVLDRVVQLGGGDCMLMEHLVLHFLPKIFRRYQVVSSALVRLLRSADLDLDEALEQAPDQRRTAMEELLRTRQRLQPVRLDWQGSFEPVEQLCRALHLPKAQTFDVSAPLDLRFLYQLRESLSPRSELFYPHRLPQPPAQVDPARPMLDQLRERDLLLSYPFESMEPFLRLLREAGRDPSVRSISMTLYRVARNSQVVDALCQAALNGKDVLVLVELRARFDEENNIGWSRVLEHAGCRVVYGMRGIKIHAKLCLITTQENGETRYYTQFGTGNYNEQTARQYTDLSLMTADQDLGAQTEQVFARLAAGELVENCKDLLVAPRCLRKGLCALMDAEIAKAKAGQDCYIGIKCNSLTDRVLMDKLVEASQAGVEAELVVRGICCLVSGIPGYTDHIKVVSIVGRYLEHSRVYLFGRGKGQKTYLSSADFMSRNTTRRVEAAAPVRDSALEARVREMFRVMMADNVKGREQCSDGSYRHRSPGKDEPINAQSIFCSQAE